MRTTPLHGAVILLLTLGGCAEQAVPIPAPSAGGPPRIHIPQTARSLGEIPLGPQEIAIEVFNRGQTDLVLIGIETSCACTDADVEKGTVPPGGQTTLTVRITPTQPEERAARLTIHSNDPDRRKTEVTLDWRAVGPFSVEPSVVDFGIVRPNESTTRELRLIHDLNSGVSSQRRLAEGLECRPASLLTARRINEETVDGKRIERWEVVLNPTGDYPTEQGSVTFHFDNGGPSKTIVPVAWRTRQPIEASPPRLFLGSGAGGRTVSSIAVVTSDDDSQMDVMSVRWASDVLDLQVTHSQVSASTVEIRVEGEVPLQSGFLTDELIVRCARPLEHELRVPVSTFVTSQSETD